VRLRALAPGKVNLCLFLGPVRDDGRHELVTLFESVSLADEVSVSIGGDHDEVLSPGVDGPNLVDRALARLRARGWDGPFVRVEIDKRVPVAAGMGGGSADAAAMLRIAQRLSPLPDQVVAEIAAELGADVPSQLAPGLVLGLGAGELVEPRPPLAAHAFLILPLPFALSTADVYAEADRLELRRSRADLRERLAEVEADPAGVIVNDLEPAALSLRPEIEDALDAARGAGADQVFVCGSGPTVAGLYWGEDASARAASGAEALAGRYSQALPVFPVFAQLAEPQPC
jgi:4-diphosphocytidyl-2-C-methyl-D-erythritol kinase